MLGSIFGILWKRDNKSWKDITEAGLAVGIVYAIVGFTTSLISVMGVELSTSLVPGVAIDIISGPLLLILVPVVGLIGGIVETLVGAGLYVFVEEIDKALK